MIILMSDLYPFQINTSASGGDKFWLPDYQEKACSYTFIAKLMLYRVRARS